GARRAQLFGAIAFEFRNMTTFAATGQPPRLIETAKLDSFVAIALLRSHLEHVTRAGLHNGDGDAQPRFVIDLRHPDLAAEYSLSHRDIPVIFVAPQDARPLSRITRDASDE